MNDTVSYDIPFLDNEVWRAKLETLHASRTKNLCASNVASDLAEQIAKDQNEVRSHRLVILLSAVAEYAYNKGYEQALSDHKP